MNYCKKCGQKLQEGATFCGNCGTKLNSDQDQSTVASSPWKIFAEKKLKSKGTKMAVIGILAAIVLLFSAHGLLQHLFSKERLIEQFEQALYEKDSEKLADLITSNDKNMKVNEEAVQGFLTYFEKHPEEISLVIDSLKSQANLLEQQEGDLESFLESLAGSFLSSNLVYLESDGKFLFYDRYKLTVPAVYVQLETNYMDTVLYIDEEEVGKADVPNFQGTFGPFLPGYHTVKASLKTDFIELTNEEELYISGTTNKISSSIYLDASEITFYFPDRGSGNGTAKLYINGKDTGVNLKEYSTFGPVMMDGSMTWQVESEMPWGTVKTEELPIEERYIEIDYLTPEIGDALMETVHAFLTEWTVAYTNVDTSNMTTATEAVKEGILSDATYDQKYDKALSVEYLSSQFDVDSLYLYYEDGVWKGEVAARSYFNRDEFYVDYDEQPEPTTESDEYTFTLVYDEQQESWLVSETYGSWYFDDSNVVEYEVEEPIAYTSVWVSGAEESGE